MKKLNLILLFVISLTFLDLNAQINRGEVSNIDYLRVQKMNNHENSELLLKEAMGLSNTSELKKIKESKTNNIIHSRYKQYADGVRIVGADIVTHQRQGGILDVNGVWIKKFNKRKSLSINESKAVDIAIKSCGDAKFYWEVPIMEKRLKSANGKNSSYFPKAELVWYDKDYTKNPDRYVLAYATTVFVFSPRAKYLIYVDATSGKIISKHNVLEHIKVPGKGTAVYAGKVDITVDSLAPDNFVLKDEKRNGNTTITTFDASDSFDPVVVSDENNVWGEENEIEDRSAVEAHYAIEKTIDFYYKYFGRKSYDDKGADVIVNVHVKDEGKPLANAFWDGQAVNFGDGDQNFPHSFAQFTIAAHEFTHSITEKEANLAYFAESGAINEAMSDMFAITIEYFMLDGKYNWQMGEELGSPIRDMSNPKSLNMPSTYKGEHWLDQGDVHVNSAIANLWYYYLVEGGSGLNDVGSNFIVNGVGFDSASKIIYACLTDYLTSNSDYADFRKQSLQAAVDLFGACSSEYLAVANAWYAVGVGKSLNNNNLSVSELLSPVSACRLSDEPVSIKLVYSSCNDSLPANTAIKFYYTINNKDTVVENKVTDSIMKGGDSFIYTFNKLVDLNNPGNYQVHTWFERDNEGFPGDDNLSLNIENRPNQNADLEVKSIVIPDNLHCESEFDTIKANVVFLGCDSLSKGIKIPFEITVGDNPVIKKEYLLSKTLFYKDSLLIPLVDNYELTSLGENTISVEVKFPNDAMSQNNLVKDKLDRFKKYKSEQAVKFADDEDIDKFNISKGMFLRHFDYRPLKLVNRDDDATNKSLLITGGFGFDPDNGFEPLWVEPESPDKVWDVNKGFMTDVCLCIDATEWDSVFLKFDLRMLSEDFFYEQFNLQPELYCNFRIKVNGEQVSPTYHVDVNNTSYRKEFYDLSKYAGTSFELCFEGQNIFERTIDDETKEIYPGDDIELDNILISRESNYTSTKEFINRGVDFVVYPNPAIDFINVKYYSSEEGVMSYKLLPVNGGSPLMTKKVNVNKGNNTTGLRLHNVPQGMYYLQILSKNGSKIIPVSIIY